MSQLPADCLNEIFEYLENDKISLHSCLLVNRLWCEVSVRILWKSNLNYNYRAYYTLISCLPNTSKEILSKFEIIISTLTSNPPMFNYAEFCRVLSTDRIYDQVKELLKNQQSILSQNLNENNIIIVTQLILELFIKQIPSLKKLNYYWNIPNLIFTSYPAEAKCLKNLSELKCRSNINSEFFYHLSRICHNIRSFTIEFERVVSYGLTDLISVQQNLKYFDIKLVGCDCNGLTGIIPLLTTKLSNTLIKLQLHNAKTIPSLLFINNFTNLQELELISFNISFEGFEKLQYTIFPQLQILKFQCPFPRYELLIKFLEINGGNLKELYLSDMRSNNYGSLNLAIAKFCTNLRKLSTRFKNDELETLKMVFNCCKYLESFGVVVVVLYYI